LVGLLSGWLVGLLSDWLAGLLLAWLVGLLLGWLAGLLLAWLVGLLLGWLAGLLSDWLVRFKFMAFNATLSNISLLSWQLILLMEETGGPGENHRPVKMIQ
jgi:ribose/xylose/arabinose/galactoside ABC-type transport system permease subunit